MAYTRKTTDEYDILADYGYGYEVVTTEATLNEAKQRAREYQENDTYAHAHDIKIKKRRVKKSTMEGR
jgi:hypothetical protein